MANAYYANGLPYGGCLCDVCRQANHVTRNPAQKPHSHEFFDSGKIRRDKCYCGEKPRNGRVRTHVRECRCRDCFINLYNRKCTYWLDNPVEARAYNFFYSHLTTRQRYTLSSYGYVDVLARNRSRWRLDMLEYSGNAYHLTDRGRAWEGYCIILDYAYSESLPAFDHFLAQLLMLRTRPMKFKEIGVPTGFHDCEGVLARPWKAP